MQMNINVDAASNRILRNDNLGLFLASKWARHMNKYVPKRTGLLGSNVMIRPFEVEYMSVYAHFQWVGKVWEDPIYHKGGFFKSTYGWWSRPGVKKVATNRNLNYSKDMNPLACSHWEVPTQQAFGVSVAREVTEYLRRQ